MAGRKPGIPNKLTRDMKERAAFHGDVALMKIRKLMDSDDESISLKAANDLLDRGYGKPAQMQIITGDEDGGPVEIRHSFKSNI